MARRVFRVIKCVARGGHAPWTTNLSPPLPPRGLLKAQVRIGLGRPAKMLFQEALGREQPVRVLAQQVLRDLVELAIKDSELVAKHPERRPPSGVTERSSPGRAG